jgi:hypothetical protein
MALFAWLISHQPTVLFSQNKPVINNQPAVLFSQNKPAPAISHQPNEQAAYLHHTNSNTTLEHSSLQEILIPRTKKNRVNGKALETNRLFFYGE